MSKIAIIGGGKIGEALIAGLVQGGTNPKDIRVVNRRAERSAELIEKYGVIGVSDPLVGTDGAGVVFLCVKPQDTVEMLGTIADRLNTNDNDTIVVSMAAGISLRVLEDVVSAGTPVLRVMPNTPMLIGQGVAAVSVGRFVSADQQEEVVKLLQSVGTVVTVQESQMDAVTALSGSSPAYLFLLVEALVDAGVQLGLSRQLAQQLASGAMAGAANMALQSELEPQQLRANVTSPGGTTAAAIRAFEEHGLRAAVYAAVGACAKRSAQLQTAGLARPEDDD